MHDNYLLRQEVFVGRPAARLVSPRRCQTNRTKHQKQRENDYVCPHLENPDRQIQFSSQNHKKVSSESSHVAESGTDLQFFITDV